MAFGCRPERSVMADDREIVDWLREAMAEWRRMPDGPEKDRVGRELERKISGTMDALDQLISPRTLKN